MHGVCRQWCFICGSMMLKAGTLCCSQNNAGNTAARSDGRQRKALRQHQQPTVWVAEGVSTLSRIRACVARQLPRLTARQLVSRVATPAIKVARFCSSKQQRQRWKHQQSGSCWRSIGGSGRFTPDSTEGFSGSEELKPSAVPGKSLHYAAFTHPLCSHARPLCGAGCAMAGCLKGL